MSKKIVTTIFLVLLPLWVYSGVWQTYDNLTSAMVTSESPNVKLISHDGYIWGIWGSGIWRFNPKTDDQTITYPNDWLEAGGMITNQMVSKNGDHWFVVEEAGLIQYDGINWSFHDLSENQIRGSDGIAKDSLGRIWVATALGLVYFDENEWKFLDKINDTSINSGAKLICSDNEGNIWLAYVSRFESEFLAKNTGDDWTIYPLPEEYSFADPSYKIHADSVGGIWFTGFDPKGKIFRFYNDVFTPLRSGGIKSFTKGNDGSLWIQDSRTYKYKYINEEWITFEPKSLYPEISNLWLGEITAQPDGSLWIIAFDYSKKVPIGFTVIKDGDMSRHDLPFTTFPSFLNMVSLNETQGTVLCDFAPLQIKDIKNPQALTSLNFDSKGIDSVFAYDIMIDSLNRIWFADGGLLVSFDDGVPTYYQKESWWPPQGEARTLTEARDGTIWLAMKTQLFSYKDDVWNEATMSSYQTCQNLTVDTSGIVWLACGNKGLYKYDGKDCVKVELPGNVNDVSADSKGSIWAGTSERLYYIIGDNIIKYAEEEGLPGKRIQHVEVSSDDSVWFNWRDILESFPSTGGVCHFDGTNLEVYRPKDGLASHDVRDIAVSDVGIVWFATDAGLSTFDINAVPDPKIRTGVNKNNLKAGDEFKLGINLQNRGPQMTVKLLTALLYNDNLLYYDFTSGQFTSNFSTLLVSLPEDLKFNTEIWKIEVPNGLEGEEIIFGSALLYGGASEIIGDISIETINFEGN